MDFNLTIGEGNHFSVVQFSAVNLVLAGIPLTNALGESMPSRH